MMTYNTEKDELISTDLLDMGQSEIIGSIARKWGITVEKALQNIKLRTEIKKTIVDYSKENKELLEAPANRDANNAFWMLIEESKMRNKIVNYNSVQKKWMKWFKDYVGRIT